MELMQANREWSSRPADQRVLSIGELFTKAKAYADATVERPSVPTPTIKAVAINGDVQLMGKAGIPAKLTNWAFSQLARLVGAPADYLTKLSAELAASNLNEGLAKRDQGTLLNMLFHLGEQGQDVILRAITSEKYTRLWNWEVAERLLAFEANGWKPATPTFAGMQDEKSTACYVSDRDMFAFICHPDRVIKEAGNDKGLLRGLIAVNSEVGDKRLKLMKFMYREMCGNHIIWGAEDVTEMSARHIGDIRGRVALWDVAVTRYMNESSVAEEEKIRTWQNKRIAGTKEELLDALFGKRSLLLSRKALEASYDAINPDEDGDPLTPWGMAQGITRYSQTLPFADKRTELDAAAGRLLEAF